MENMKDITIIGGGPAGMFASFYSGLRGMSVRIVEFQDKLGGKMHVYPEKIIWDIGGVAPKPCYEVIQDIVAQGLHFSPEVKLNERVIDIKKLAEQHFVVETESGEVFHSKAVIIAVGGGIIKPMTLDIEGAERYEVANLNYVVQSVQKYKDKHVLISGAGNAALDWAADLAPHAKSLTLCYRKDEISGHEHMKDELTALGVVEKKLTAIKQLIGDESGKKIKEVVLVSTEDGTEEVLAVDEVIISHGFNRDAALVDNASVRLARHDDFYIQGQGNARSSVDGIFACGDILKHEAKVHLIASAFNDGANAANLAKKYIEPEAYDNGRVSSHNEVFKEKNKEVLKKYLVNA